MWHGTTGASTLFLSATRRRVNSGMANKEQEEKEGSRRGRGNPALRSFLKDGHWLEPGSKSRRGGTGLPCRRSPPGQVQGRRVMPICRAWSWLAHSLPVSYSVSSRLARCPPRVNLLDCHRHWTNIELYQSGLGKVAHGWHSWHFSIIRGRQKRPRSANRHSSRGPTSSSPK